jgi:hypothetical protein
MKYYRPAFVRLGFIRRQVFDVENRFAELVAARRENVADGSTDHLRDNAFDRQISGVARADRSPVAQNRDAIAHLEHFAEFVRNVNHADAAPFQIAQNIKQRFDFRFGQRGGRLVQNQNVRVLRQRFGDFDNCCDPIPKLPTGVFGFIGKFKSLEAVRLCRKVPSNLSPEARRLAPQKNVSATVSSLTRDSS